MHCEIFEIRKHIIIIYLYVLCTATTDHILKYKLQNYFENGAHPCPYSTQCNVQYCRIRVRLTALMNCDITTILCTDIIMFINRILFGAIIIIIFSCRHGLKGFGRPVPCVPDSLVVVDAKHAHRCTAR